MIVTPHDILEHQRQVSFTLFRSIYVHYRPKFLDKSHITNCRAVTLLATLLIPSISYMKLLRTIIDAISVAMIMQYPQNNSYAVWYLDCHYPHSFLFIAAIATLVFLWLPYTLLLLFIQPLKRVSHLRPLKWINKFAPVLRQCLFLSFEG